MLDDHEAECGRTLRVAEGAQRRATNSYAAVLVRVYGLRPFAPAIADLFEAARDGIVDLESVTRVIERDVTLAARLLRLVRFAADGGQGACSSIREAVALVGAETLWATALPMLLMSDTRAESRAMSCAARHATLSAALARRIGELAGVGALDQVYLAGLVHDIGQVALLRATDELASTASETDPYPRALAELAHESNGPHLHEQELFGFDHAVLGGCLLREWRLPDPLPEVVLWHHEPSRGYGAGGDLARLLAIVRLASRCASRLSDSQPPEAAELQEHDDAVAHELLSLRPAELASRWPELRAIALASGATWTQGVARIPRAPGIAR